MREENRTTLEQYRRQYNAWVNDTVLYDLDGAAKQKIIEVIRAEWDPYYSTDVWCGHCVAKMLVYAFEQMDKESTQAAPPIVDAVRIKLNE